MSWPELKTLATYIRSAGSPKKGDFEIITFINEIAFSSQRSAFKCNSSVKSGDANNIIFQRAYLMLFEALYWIGAYEINNYTCIMRSELVI